MAPSQIVLQYIKKSFEGVHWDAKNILNFTCLTMIFHNRHWASAYLLQLPRKVHRINLQHHGWLQRPFQMDFQGTPNQIGQHRTVWLLDWYNANKFHSANLQMSRNCVFSQNNSIWKYCPQYRWSDQEFEIKSCFGDLYGLSHFQNRMRSGLDWHVPKK